jgi:hypothetical protein
MPDGTVACVTDQLEGLGVPGGAATGHTNILVIVRNRSATDCWLEGFPDVTIFDAASQVLAQATGPFGRGTFFDDGPVVRILIKAGTPPLASTPLDPGGALGQAFMNVEWVDCRRLRAETLVLALPDGGGSMSVPFAVAGTYSPICDGVASSTYSALGRGPFSPSGTQWPPPPKLLSIDVTISAPATVQRGSVLAYSVTLSNRSELDYRLDSCPDYSEFLGAKVAGGLYQLNCNQLGAIPAGGSATFAMQLAIPTTVPAGMTQLTWAFSDGTVTPASAEAEVTIL